MPRFARTDFANLIPDPEEGLRAFQSVAPEFTRCPRGHKLPHRVDSGLCWADFCADDGSPRVDAPNDAIADPNKSMASEMDLLPRGMEPLATAHRFEGAEDAARHQAQREEALAIARAYGHEQARSLIHSLPGIPAPPKGLSGDEYYEQRLEQVGPYVLEKMIFLAQFGTPEQQKHYVDELAERYKSKKREISPRGVMPFALVVQGGQDGKIGVFVNPYDQQLQMQSTAAIPKSIEVQSHVERVRSEPAVVQPASLPGGHYHAAHPGAPDVHPGSGEDADGPAADPLEGIPPFWAEQAE